MKRSRPDDEQHQLDISTIATSNLSDYDSESDLPFDTEDEVRT